jgi:hypothetical protein
VTREHSQPPQWPEEGEDVRTVDPFALNEGDRIYILGQGSDLEGILELGPASANERFRHAWLISPADVTRREMIIPKGKLPIKVGQPYDVEPAKKGKIIATARIHFIRIVRAKPVATPKPAACPANP